VRVAIRADASVEIGTGHVMRCLALADELAARDVAVRFVCRAVPEALAGRIRAAGHQLATLSPPRGERAGTRGDEPGVALAHAGWLPTTQAEDAEATLAALADGEAFDWLVVDHYALDARWERAVRARARRLLAVDDLADRPHEVDALLDQNVQRRGSDRYAGLLPERCRRLVGPAHALLRPEFREAARPGAPVVSRRFLVNVALGGVDQGGVTVRAVEALARLPRDRFAVDVITGGANPHRQRLEALCRDLPNVRLFVDVAGVAELFRAADLGLGAGGVSALERAGTGLPQLLVSIAANQRPGCEAMAAARVALDLGDGEALGGEALEWAVARLADRPGLLRRMGRRAAALVDGRGAERVALYLCREALTLRPAARSDAAMAWRWRNDPFTRRYVFDPNPIPWETHLGWWERSLASPARSLLVLESGRRPVGILRFDHDGDASVISIYVDPALASLGLGSMALRAGERWIAEHRRSTRTIVAEILPANAQSRRTFAAAGYRETEDPVRWLRPVRRSGGGEA
jgi:UDP-2,4-diacetamido-2,4,6-trideoxy-beta-L-altropyranose hydrolase